MHCNKRNAEILFISPFFLNGPACCCFWHDQIHLPHARIDHARCTFVLLSTNARPSACVTHSKLRQQTATSIRVENIALLLSFYYNLFSGAAHRIFYHRCALLLLIILLILRNLIISGSDYAHHRHFLWTAIRLKQCKDPFQSISLFLRHPLSLKLLRIPSFFPPTAIFLNRLNQQNKKGKPHSSTTWTRPSRTTRCESYESESLIICCSLVA